MVASIQANGEAPAKHYVFGFLDEGWVLFALAVFNSTWPIIHNFRRQVNRKPMTYGRYSEASADKGFWMMPIPPRIYWFIMEVPNLVMGYWQLRHVDLPWTDLRMVIPGLFLLHYVLRTFVYSFLLRGGASNTPKGLVLALLFTMLNGSIQVGYHTRHMHYGENELTSPRAVIGIAIFFFGLISNHISDTILRNLRKDPKDRNHYIPHGYLFEYVSGANFLSESIEWLGYAIASNSIAGWGFFISTVGVVGGRAVDHHNWYLNKFKDEYPKDRKAFIPFVF